MPDKVIDFQDVSHLLGDVMFTEGRFPCGSGSNDKVCYSVWSDQTTEVCSIWSTAVTSIVEVDVSAR